MILSLSIATVVMGTAGLNLVTPVFAGGDHHDDGEKKCKDNGDNNCNDTHKTQKIYAKNECEIENENKDHPKIIYMLHLYLETENCGLTNSQVQK